MNSLECHACRGDIAYEAKDHDTTVECPHCYTLVKISSAKMPPPVPHIPSPNSDKRQCNVCSGVASNNAYFCPHCGEPIRGIPIQKISPLFYLTAVVYLIIGAAVILFGGFAVLNYMSKIPNL